MSIEFELLSVFRFPVVSSGSTTEAVK